MTETASKWDASLEAAVCERCHWRCLAPLNHSPRRCPNCRSESLSVLPGGLSEMPYPSAPELVLPFQVKRLALEESVAKFSAGIPFPPSDLKPSTMLARLEQVYLPVWLVDARVAANWQAEAGFNYQVVSHQEFFDQETNGWQSREIQETRIIWDNRVGQIRRAYQNIAAPALDDSQRIENQLGPFNHTPAFAYTPDQINDAWVRLPDNSPKEAWTEASAAFQKTAADDCRQACAADHMRQFHWKAEFSDFNWTLMLLPVFCTVYLDDKGNPCTVMINGQTGKITGTRSASLKRAGKWGLSILIASIVLLVIGQLLEFFLTGIFPGLIGLSTAIFVLGFLGILSSAIPYLMAWDFNRKQELQQQE